MAGMLHFASQCEAYSAAVLILQAPKGHGAITSPHATDAYSVYRQVYRQVVGVHE